jgi:hypothetical protein
LNTVAIARTRVPSSRRHSGEQQVRLALSGIPPPRPIPPHLPFSAGHPGKEADAIWQRYIDFEGRYGELLSVRNLEHRRKVAQQRLAGAHDPEAAASGTPTLDDLVVRCRKASVGHGLPSPALIPLFWRAGLQLRHRFLDLLPCPRELLPLYAPAMVGQLALWPDARDHFGGNVG